MTLVLLPQVLSGGEARYWQTQEKPSLWLQTSETFTFLLRWLNVCMIPGLASLLVICDRFVTVEHTLAWVISLVWHLRVSTMLGTHLGLLFPWEKKTTPLQTEHDASAHNFSNYFFQSLWVIVASTGFSILTVSWLYRWWQPCPVVSLIQMHRLLGKPDDLHLLLQSALGSTLAGILGSHEDWLTHLPSYSCNFPFTQG